MSISDFPMNPLPKDMNCRRLRGFHLDVFPRTPNVHGLCENCTYTPSTHVFNIGATQHHLCAKCFGEMLMCFVGESVGHPVAQSAEVAERIGGGEFVTKKVLDYIDHRFDALESNIFQARIATMPNSNYSDEKIVADIDYELSKEARNDTLATDRITRLANRIEFYGCTNAEFAAKNRYWKARVAYLRHGDYPNPGIDRNSPAFTEILKECVEMIRPTAIPAEQKECPE